MTNFRKLTPLEQHLSFTKTLDEDGGLEVNEEDGTISLSKEASRKVLILSGVRSKRKRIQKKVLKRFLNRVLRRSILSAKFITSITYQGGSCETIKL